MKEQVPTVVAQGERCLCLGECWIIVEGNVPDVEESAHCLCICLVEREREREVRRRRLGKRSEEEC